MERDTAKEIRDADEALGWLSLIRWPNQRRAAQLRCRTRAQRAAFSDLAALEADSCAKLRRRLGEALDAITDDLNRGRAGSLRS